MTAPALRLEDLQVSGHDGRVFLHIARLEVPAGQTVALRGPSGAGKSTLLHMLSGLLRPRSGRVIWGGQDIVTLSEDARARFRRQMLGLVFQDSYLGAPVVGTTARFREPSGWTAGRRAPV